MSDHDTLQRGEQSADTGHLTSAETDALDAGERLRTYFILFVPSCQYFTSQPLSAVSFVLLALQLSLVIRKWSDYHDTYYVS